MNQRFQNEDIRRVSELYADNELYKAISTIGAQLESEMGEFGMCSEECLMETLELLTAIADRGEEIMDEADNIWLLKYNEYRRFDRHVAEGDIRKAVGIVFGFAVLAIDSSKHPFYRYRLAERLTHVVACSKFDGWQSTLDRIFSVPLREGWFDAFIDEEPEKERNTMVLENGVRVSSQENRLPHVTVNYIEHQHNSNCQQFMGKMENPQFISSQQDER